MHAFRTHKCNELKLSDVGKTIKLSGWIQKKRDHGSMCFIDLRDSSGIIQLVALKQQELSDNCFSSLIKLNCESVITVIGIVKKKTDQTINTRLSTGRLEIIINSFNTESFSEIPPISVSSSKSFPEELRLKYRFLDLRRKIVHENIILRSKVIRYIRDQMYSIGFTEFQTPILTAGSPEGARDFIVPSRLHLGKFYSLPQAPQQFKQLLMASGFEKYFQIAPCFRDEDARSDRAPGEFYQLDIEMSFIEQEDIFQVVEPLLRRLFQKFSNWHTSDNPFPRISYQESMLKYGTDKPDLRNPIIIYDITDIFQDFSLFSNTNAQGSLVRGIPIHDQNLSNKFYKKIIDYCDAEINKTISYMAITAEGHLKGPMAKSCTEQQLEALKQKCSLKNGDSIFVVSTNTTELTKLSAKLRQKIAEELQIIQKDTYKFCWITDYPLYELDQKTGRIDFFHNPFSKPQGGIEALQKAKTMNEILSIKAYQYDIVCNGVELSSGAMRNHELNTLYKTFEYAGYSQDKVKKNFPALINAFKYGAPPHGGIAPGIDRIMMLLANTMNIREVIAFPLNQNAQDLLMNAPSEIDTQVLDDLSLKLVK